MKLQDKTNLYFFGGSLFIFCIGGVFFYFLFIGIINRDFDHKLHELRSYTVKQIAHTDSVLLYQKYSANTITIVPLTTQVVRSEELSDTVIFDVVEKADKVYRQLTSYEEINGKPYRITVRRDIPEESQVIEGVAILVFLLFAALVATLSLINNKLSRILWAPFYQILDKINHYRIDRAESLEFRKSSVDEFNILAGDITKMTRKIRQEFNIQKEFIENASHEIQTPLAIITNKIELLLQTSNLSEEQLQLINSSMTAVRRLSKLNEALLIISRIENRQFHYVEDISVNKLLERLLENLGELIQMKSIDVQKVYANDIIVLMNPYLADILLENLVTNAIKHNLEGGFIHIVTEQTTLTIYNTGAKPADDTSKIFQRFMKLNKKSNSVGLGLSIVKGICETYGYTITYGYDHQVHRMSIQFTDSVPVRE